MRPCNTHHTDDSKGRIASGSHVHNIFFLQTVRRGRRLRYTREKHSLYKRGPVITTHAADRLIIVLICEMIYGDHLSAVPRRRAPLGTAGNTGHTQSTAHGTALHYC